MRKLMIFIGTVGLAIALYNVDSFHGQWKFNQLCEEEGGPRMYAKIERNAGWLVEDKNELAYEGPFHFGDVAFVRWQNKKGERFDVYVDWDLKKKPYPRKSEYIFLPVDETRTVRYKYQYTSTQIPTDERFSKTVLEIIDLNTNRVVASYTEFGYQWTKPERVILSAPTGVRCWGGETREMQQIRENFYRNIYSYQSK